MGYTSVAPADEKLRAAEKFWDDQGITADGTRPVASFVGTLGRHFELETVLAAAKALHADRSPVQFVIAGTGDRLEYYRQLCSGLDNVIFPGWVDAAAIHVLMRRSIVGLDPLLDRYDFLATINNKAIEYLSAGLPVVSSPTRGELARLLEQEQCGLSYDIHDAAGLAVILKQLCGDRPRLGRLAENARRVFQKQFTAEKVYGDMMAYLEGIAGARVAL
jgi:glycosyltransferase involved in cell wall biosynthesis